MDNVSKKMGTCQKEGVTTVKAPGFLPIRWQGREHLGKAEQARIQENVTNKFLRAFRRLAFHVPGIEIIAYPDNKQGYLEIKLGELNPDNQLFKEIKGVIE